MPLGTLLTVLQLAYCFPQPSRKILTSSIYSWPRELILSFFGLLRPILLGYHGSDILSVGRVGTEKLFAGYPKALITSHHLSPAVLRRNHFPPSAELLAYVRVNCPNLFCWLNCLFSWPLLLWPRVGIWRTVRRGTLLMWGTLTVWVPPKGDS